MSREVAMGMSRSCSAALAAVLSLCSMRGTVFAEPLDLTIRGANPDYRAVSRSELGTIRTYDRHDIDSFTPLAADTFLARVPGFSLFRRSNSLVTNPTAQGVSLRGVGPSGASRTVVLLDGVPINDPFGGWVNWQSIPLEGVDRISVQENWGSPHWSFLGLGSSIELQTREPSTESRTVKLLGGTQDTGSGHAIVSAAGERSGFTAGGEYAESGGYKVVSTADRGPIDRDVYTSHKLGYGKVGWRPSEDSSLSLLWNAFDEDRGGGTELTSNESRSYRIGASGTLERIAGGSARFDLFGVKAAFNSTFSSQSPDRASEMPASDQFGVPSSEVGGAVDWSRRTSSNRYIEFGADVLGRSGETNEFFRFQEGAFLKERRAGADQLAAGAYGFHRYRFDSGTTVDAFLRADGWRNTDVFRTERDLLSGEIDRDDDSDGPLHGFLGPRLQATRELGDHESFRTALTRSFRIPTVNELARPFRVRNDVTEANPDLAAEEILGYDAEYRYEDGTYTLSVVGFANRIRNAIANVTQSVPACGVLPEDGICRRRENLDELWSAGGELEAQYAVSDADSVGVSYLYTASDVTDPGAAANLKGKRAAQLPLHQASLRYERRGESFRAFVQGRFVGNQFEDDLNTLTLDRYATVDASVTVPVRRFGELFLTAQNLLGERYDVGKTAGGVTSIGSPLVLFAGVRVRF